MKLEVFKNKRYSTEAPAVEMRYNSFKLNKELYQVMGNPRFVKFALDHDEKILGIAKCDGDYLNRFTVTERTRNICSATLSKEIRKIIRSNHARITFTFDSKEDGYFITHLDEGVFNGE